MCRSSSAYEVDMIWKKQPSTSEYCAKYLLPFNNINTLRCLITWCVYTDCVGARSSEVAKTDFCRFLCLRPYSVHACTMYTIKTFTLFVFLRVRILMWSDRICWTFTATRSCLPYSLMHIWKFPQTREVFALYGMGRSMVWN